MADVTKYLKVIGGLAIALLVIMIIFAVTLLIGSKFKEKICIQEGGTYSSGACWTDTNVNVSLSSSAAFNATRDLFAEIISVVGWIGILILAAIGGILIAMARSFWDNKGNNGM